MDHAGDPDDARGDLQQGESLTRSAESGLSASRLRLWAALGLCAIGGLVAALFHQTVMDAALSMQPGLRGVAITAAILFLWFLGSQLVLAPSGTISIVLGGVAVGPLAGVLYFAAMLTAGAAVQRLARPVPGQAERLIRHFAPGRPARRFARTALRRMRRAPIAATAALRLVPVAPSAACALTLAAAGVSHRSLTVGTLEVIRQAFSF